MWHPPGMNPTRSLPFSALILPKEHGSWSLAFEPVLLFLLVAPSAAGTALAVGAGFFTRRPLKLGLTLPVTDPRQGPARTGAGVLALIAAIALSAAALLGPLRLLWPLLLAAPLGGLFLWFDLRNAMRETEAELAGSAAFALLPATGATLAGWPASAALALAVVALARSVPTVLTIRSYLRRSKGRPASALPAIAAASVAFARVAALALAGWVPPSAVAVGAVLWFRTAWLLSALCPAWPARKVGLMEAVLGVVLLGALTCAYRFR
jgi:hypothetical protein